MSENKSAFPVNNAGSVSTNTGMDLKDYFAAKALTGIIANPYYDEAKPSQYADIAYSIAEEMMKRRDKK